MEVGIQNLLIKLEEKVLQWFGNVKTMYRTRILIRQTPELKFKGKNP
jgi:hypothetical protein